MHQRLTELTDALEQSTVTLLEAYQTEELYALRVGMRRIRSLLKPLGSARSRSPGAKGLLPGTLWLGWRK